MTSEALTYKQFLRKPCPQTIRIDIGKVISKRATDTLTTLQKPLISKPPGARANPSTP